MSELEKKVEALGDEELNEAVGGMTANYRAALDVMEVFEVTGFLDILTVE